jgi:hypothetical protein
MCRATGVRRQRVALSVLPNGVGTSEDGDRIQSLKRRVLNEGQNSGQCPEL